VTLIKTIERLARRLRVHDRHRPDDLVRIGVRLRPEFLRAIVLDLGDVEVAVGVDVDLMDAVELAGLRPVSSDVRWTGGARNLSESGPNVLD
jgi:hypothetical protein